MAAASELIVKIDIQAMPEFVEACRLVDELTDERDMLRRGIRRHNIEFEKSSRDAPGQYDLRLWALLENCGGYIDYGPNEV